MAWPPYVGLYWRNRVRVVVLHVKVERVFFAPWSYQTYVISILARS